MGQERYEYCEECRKLVYLVRVFRRRLVCRPCQKIVEARDGQPTKKQIKADKEYEKQLEEHLFKAYGFRRVK